PFDRAGHRVADVHLREGFVVLVEERLDLYPAGVGVVVGGVDRAAVDRGVVVGAGGDPERVVGVGGGHHGGVLHAYAHVFVGGPEVERVGVGFEFAVGDVAVGLGCVSLGEGVLLQQDRLGQVVALRDDGPAALVELGDGLRVLLRAVLAHPPGREDLVPDAHLGAVLAGE